MSDYSDLLAGNPYFAQPSEDQRNAGRVGSLGQLLLGLGAGISSQGGSGQPWFNGVAPGLYMGMNAITKQKEQDDLEQARRFQMGLHLQQLKQLQDDRDTKNAGIAAWVKNNPGAGTPDAPSAVPGGGLNVQPNPVQMGQGTYTAKTAGSESGGRYDIANGMGSGAYGKYQFMPDTWAGVAKAHPDLGLPFNMKQATRDQQEAAMNAFTADNAGSLKAGGFDPNPANLYLAHRFGTAGAGKVLSADPNTPIASLFPASWAQQNPDMQGKTVGQFTGAVRSRYGVLPPYEGPGMGDNQNLMPGPQPPPMPPSASPVLPPFQIPGQPQPAVPTAGLQPNVAQGGSDASPVPQPIQPAQFTPPPALPAPGPPPQVPRPQLSAEEANQLNNMVMTRQITPQQAEAEKNKLINEKWSRSQTAATEAWKQQNENYRFNRGLAEKSDTYRPLTAPEARQLGLPENVQYQLNTKTNKVEPMTNTKQPRFEDVKDSAGRITGQRNVDTNQYHPINQNNATDFSIPKELKGEEVYQALIDAGQIGKANEIKSMVEGDNPIPPPGVRTPSGIATRDLVFQAAGPGFTDAVHAERLKMKTEMNKGKIGTALRAQGTLFNHLNEGLNIADDLNNSPFPLVNKIGNAMGVASGDPRVAEMQVTKTRINGELEKYFNGGTPTVSGLKQAQDELNEAQSPAQFKAAVKTITKLVAGQQSEYLNQINRGLGYIGTPKAIGADDPLILSPEAQKSREAVLARTQPNKSANSKVMDTVKETFGAKPPIADLKPAPADLLNEARNAIMKRAPRQGVIDELKKQGYSADGL